MMAPTELARRNHDELFPGHVSTVAATDPELIEVFDNFAFDEILRHGGLDVRTRLMVQLAAMIACQALCEYRVMLGAGLTVGVTPVEAKEIVYQAVPYVGMARVFDFIHATNEVLTERGIELPPTRTVPSSTSLTPAGRSFRSGRRVGPGVGLAASPFRLIFRGDDKLTHLLPFDSPLVSVLQWVVRVEINSCQFLPISLPMLGESGAMTSGKAIKMADEEFRVARHGLVRLLLVPIV